MLFILFSLLVLFNVLDTYQTYLIINLGGSELNPILNYLIDKFGFYPGVLGFKLFWLSLLGFCIYKKGDRKWK